MGRSPLGPATLIYAHRGDRSRAPDNTLEAFALADEAGADGIELDVRITADGVLVLHHDASVDDLPPIIDLAFEDLRRSAPQVPTFVEMLAAVPHRVFLNVEIKNHPFESGYDASGSLARAVMAAAVEHDDPARMLVSSFDPATVGHCIDTGVAATFGLLMHGAMPIEDGIAQAHGLGVEALHPPYGSLAPDVSAITGLIHDAGLAVVTWDANEPHEVAAACEAGVDVAITDDPTMAREACANG
jgi:glycerophosphoryl diester phosphodiesterase